MKRKGIIQLLLIVVAMMMFAACASSRRVVSDNYQETKDSVGTELQDSVHKQVAVSDNADRKIIEDKAKEFFDCKGSFAPVFYRN